MNYSQKFNRALLKAISFNKINTVDLNGGAIRKSTVKFSFSHDGQVNYFALEASRNAQGMELFGYPEQESLTLSSWNGSYLSGHNVEIPEDIDASAVRYIKACSVISDVDALKVRKDFVEAMNRFSEQMS